MKTLLYNRLLNYNFKELFEKKGYAYFEKGAYNLNIIGIRTNNNNKVTNLFDDLLVVTYKTNDNKWVRQIYTITTEPGYYYMAKHLMNSKCTAILVPGQYRGCWQIGKHRGKYEALCQKKPIKVYRDNNMNDIYDLKPETIDKGIFGVNIHRASQIKPTTTVDKYSAGCQVFSRPQEFNAFMRLCKLQKDIYGNSFTYTLIKEEDLW